MVDSQLGDLSALSHPNASRGCPFGKNLYETRKSGGRAYKQSQSANSRQIHGQAVQGRHRISREEEEEEEEEKDEWRRKPSKSHWPMTDRGHDHCDISYG